MIDVDRVMASGWFHIFPPGPSQPLSGFKGAWQPPAIFADGGGWLTDFETADGRWLRVQGAFPTGRKRLAETLGTSVDLSEVAAAVRKYPGDEIEQKLVDAKATVALSRTIAEWLTHPAGRAAHAEPIVHVEAAAADGSSWEPTRGRPLAGIKVLDCTRVVAGPTGTRFLAACGAEVLRLDAPGSDESSSAGGRTPNDLMLGKRWAFLDLKRPEGKARFLELLSETDVFVHTYRPGGIDELVPPKDRQAARPGPTWSRSPSVPTGGAVLGSFGAGSTRSPSSLPGLRQPPRRGRWRSRRPDFRSSRSIGWSTRRAHGTCPSKRSTWEPDMRSPQPPSEG